MVEAQNENETLLKFSKWYKITLIVGIFVLIASSLYTTLDLIYWIQRAKGSYYSFKDDPIEFQLVMYIAFLVFATFRSIWLGFMTKMRKSDRESSLTVFNVIQIVVAISLGILSIFGILLSIDEMLEYIFTFDFRSMSDDIILYGALTSMGLEIFAWLFFYSFIKRKIEKDQSNSSKKIRKGIIVYVMTLGIPIIVFIIFSVVVRVFGPFDPGVLDFGGPVNVDYLAVFLNFLIIFIIFSNYLTGLFFQFRMVNGILRELER